MLQVSDSRRRFVMPKGAAIGAHTPAEVELLPDGRILISPVNVTLAHEAWALTPESMAQTAAAMEDYRAGRTVDADPAYSLQNIDVPRGCGAKGPSAIRRTEFRRERPYIMSVDADTVRRIANLARIAVTEAEVPHLQGELNAMLAFVEQLSEVNVDGVEPMTSVTPMEMKKRPDVVDDGGIADDIVRNAPATEDHFFLVPKVVE